MGFWLCLDQEAKAMALKEATQAAIQMQLDYVTFESDSQMVVHATHTNIGGKFEFSIIIRSIKNLLQCISNFEVKFIKRKTNSVVHLLAKVVNSWSRHNTFNLISPCIEFQLINEIC